MRRRPTCAPRFICRCVDRRAGARGFGRSVGRSDGRAVGLSGCRAVGLSGCRAAGLPGGRARASTPLRHHGRFRRHAEVQIGCRAGNKARERALPGLRPAVRTEARVGGQRRVAATARAATLRYAALRAETCIRRVDRAAARACELAQRHVTGRAALRIGRRLPAPAVTVAATRIVAAVTFPARSAMMPAAMAATTVSAAMTTPVAAQDPFQKAHHPRLIAASARRRTHRLSTAAATRCRRRSGSRPRRRTRPSTSCRARRP